MSIVETPLLSLFFTEGQRFANMLSKREHDGSNCFVSLRVKYDLGKISFLVDYAGPFSVLFKKDVREIEIPKAFTVVGNMICVPAGDLGFNESGISINFPGPLNEETPTRWMRCPLEYIEWIQDGDGNILCKSIAES